MTGTEKLTVHFPNQDQKEQEFYQARGFTVDRRTTWCMSGKRQKGAIRSIWKER